MWTCSLYQFVKKLHGSVKHWIRIDSKSNYLTFFAKMTLQLTKFYMPILHKLVDYHSNYQPEYSRVVECDVENPGHGQEYRQEEDINGWRGEVVLDVSNEGVRFLGFVYQCFLQIQLIRIHFGTFTASLKFFLDVYISSMALKLMYL